MTDSFVPFDRVLPLVDEALDGFQLPADAPPVYLVRNLFGRVGISVSEEARTDGALVDAVNTLATRLSEALGSRSPTGHNSPLFVTHALLDTLRDTARMIRPGIYWADRLVVGRNWSTIADAPSEDHPRRFTLYSVKGGVGRSTTAAVLAWHLARQGQDVLVVDLDLESPGLASAVLPPSAQPEFGVTDWFVEELVGHGDHIIDRMTAAPRWAHDLPGRVHVVPAHGRDPGEYLTKLGRAYMDTVDDPWTARLNRLVSRLEEEYKPTTVILESRSGLHDIAAATVTDLDAQVLLFAVDADSHWTDYGILFDHWARADIASPLRERLSIVSALTPELNTECYIAEFRDSARHLFRDRLQNERAGPGGPEEDLSVDLSSEEGQHDPFVIHWTRGFATGVSLQTIERSTVNQAYGDFLRRFDLLYGHHPPQSGTAKVDTMRLALLELPEPASYSEAPHPAIVYLPPSHRKAMHPNTALVTGMRGSGKTFWWGALQNREVRGLLGRGASAVSLNEDSVIRPGFGARLPAGDYPTRDDLSRLVEQRVDASCIWRTVQACAMAPRDHPLTQAGDWVERVKRVASKPGLALDLLQTIDAELDFRGVFGVVVFDALDRATKDWSVATPLTRGLFEHALDMRSYRRLRAKVFVRTDHLSDRGIVDIVDMSKLLSSSVDLSWPRRDLFGLLWHLLANGPRGKAVRPLLQEGEWPRTGGVPDQRVEVPYLLVEASQRDKFHEIAGPWMGTDRRRGFPYTWIPNHLADARGKVSPRSFLTALREAAIDTKDRYSEHGHALHYRSIMRGVREASMVRVREMEEDVPWAGILMKPLREQVVPCGIADIFRLWREGGVLQRLDERLADGDWRLPPRRMKRGHDGLLAELEALGICRRTKDGRIDVPDVFRIGYGLRRRGGVRPARSR